MHRKGLPLGIYLIIMTLAMSAVFCGQSNNQTDPPAEDAGSVETSVAATLAAQEPAPPQSDPTQPAQPPADPTQPQSQPGQPSISVSEDTNCRRGPSPDFEKAGFLLVGQTSTVHGRNQAGDWWYIANPRKPGSYCWLWGQYATVQGDTTAITLLTPPPPPQPVAGYVNEEYGFSLQTGTYSYEENPNSLILTKGEYKLVICFQRSGENIICRTGVPAGDWAAGGHFTLAGNTYKKDLIVYENKVKVAAYGAGPINVGDLVLQIWLDSTDPDYDAIDIPKQVLDEVDQILATFKLTD